MATYRNLNEFQRGMAKKAKELRKNDIRTPSQAATFLQATAIKLAPLGRANPRFPRYSPGETIRGIKKNRIGKGRYQVVSRVSAKGKGFRQNLWANQTAPHRTIHPRWAKGKGTVYGDGSHIITGMPRFWHFATIRANAKYNKLVRMNTKKALRVGA